MTYHSGPTPLAGNGGRIDAATYNSYADILSNIYADNIVSPVYGYGILPNIPHVVTGNDITAAQWTVLFDVIHKCGTHLGISVSPIPASVSPGDLIVAYNDYLSTQTLKDVLSILIANRFNTAISQLSVTTNSPVTDSTSWTTGKEYTWQVDFGSSINIKYFFNSGGTITFAGSYTGGSSPIEDAYWANQLNDMGTLKIGPFSCIPTFGVTSNKGVYLLTTTYQEIFYRPATTIGSYSNNFISVSAKLAAPVGTNGLVDFKISLIDNDLTPGAKTGTLSFVTGDIKSAGAIPYPGPAVVITSGTFTNVAATPAIGIPLSVTATPVPLVVDIVGAGTATTATITATAYGGTGPYTYAWANVVNTITIGTPTSASTVLSKILSAGDIQAGSVSVTATDAALTSTTYYVNWAMNSNLLNDTAP